MAFLSGEVEHQETESFSERIHGIEIRFFGADQEHEARFQSDHGVIEFRGPAIEITQGLTEPPDCFDL
jgi:hypothetical protein